MPIQRLVIDQLRNLQGVDVLPSSQLNFIFGDNGSGKTSLLEAISILAHGRSFRTSKFRGLIAHDHPHFSLFARLAREGFGEVSLGVQRALVGEAVFKVNGERTYSSASLASQLPMQIMNASSFALLEGSSKVRRQLFDWLVFHVKHEFGPYWRDYSRCVKHRNSLLRRVKITRSELAPWDRELVRLGNLIHTARVDCLQPFMETVPKLLEEGDLPKSLNIQLSYEPGWDLEQGFAGQLSAYFERDLRYGYTTIGAHKSELKIRAQGTQAHEVLSRGQQKTLIAALYIAELRVYQSLNSTPCVLLVDDLPAELDRHHVEVLGRWINELDMQVFITGINLGAMLDFWPINTKQRKVFHVKHGNINEYTA